MRYDVAGAVLLALSAFLGILSLAGWSGNETEKARDRAERRAAQREWDTLMATWAGPAGDDEDGSWPADPGALPLPGPGPDWPEAGSGSMYFFGTDLVEYDPEADTAEYLRKMEADTTAFIAARITHRAAAAAAALPASTPGPSG